MFYLALKTVHIGAALLFLGAGLMTAWYKLRADRSGDLRVVVWAQREIVRADWVFTTPSAILLPTTGVWMALRTSQPLFSGWVGVGVVGFIVTGLLWLPAVRLQIRMRRLAEAALAADTELPAEFHRLNRIWLALGVPAFLLALAIVWVMVAKWQALP